MSLKKTLIIISLLLLSACSIRPEFVPPSPDSVEFAPPKLDYSLPKPRHGSLYRSKNSFSLFTDTRAFQVGDILMVYLDEETSSKKNAGTKLGKSSGISIAIPDYGESVDVDRTFKGEGTSSQQNKLSGTITVTVYEVLPNGVLRVRGEKWITLNQGDEFIRLSGNVRVEDIDNGNGIASGRIADARITYAGKGALADSNAPGWLMQLLSSPWIPI
ncbi:flagellar basal body L-ring protein FlgH [Psychromonas sp. Urea-02u-13]|uniref:flagellar basal body L-ring protein FlgH n=1 Tax=Psychromonas sp. Urea-02u-13 TaxID=2058326 RepID=UPI000C3481DA|nr:flagellar basal body L-ring protein FlgH [Psychromonas sp. Urea-02u-13]PKG39533.1 flagellar basal body L-ring protein FlgH [Psychromonas sp. Urea-02u-13]